MNREVSFERGALFAPTRAGVFSLEVPDATLDMKASLEIKPAPTVLRNPINQEVILE
jgi:hypothetical protein